MHPLASAGRLPTRSRFEPANFTKVASVRVSRAKVLKNPLCAVRRRTGEPAAIGPDHRSWPLVDGPNGPGAVDSDPGLENRANDRLPSVGTYSAQRSGRDRR